MAGKSSIHRLPPLVKEYIQRLLREDRMTLDEMLTDLRDRFPNQQAPSRSALGRYKTGFDSMAAKMREQQANAEALVGALGEDATDKTGVLLVQAISTLTYQATLDAHDKDEVDIGDVLALARAAKATMDARTLSVKERQAIEKAARERLLQEQAEQLDQSVQAGGLTDEQAQFWRAKFLGVQR
ncbi:hypothetical protein D3C76_965020 [compost metagenome]